MLDSDGREVFADEGCYGLCPERLGCGVCLHDTNFPWTGKKRPEFVGCYDSDSMSSESAEDEEFRQIPDMWIVEDL